MSPPVRLFYYDQIKEARYESDDITRKSLHRRPPAEYTNNPTYQDK